MSKAHRQKALWTFTPKQLSSLMKCPQKTSGGSNDTLYLLSRGTRRALTQYPQIDVHINKRAPIKDHRLGQEGNFPRLRSKSVRETAGLRGQRHRSGTGTALLTGQSIATAFSVIWWSRVSFRVEHAGATPTSAPSAMLRWLAASQPLLPTLFRHYREIRRG